MRVGGKDVSLRFYHYLELYPSRTLMFTASPESRAADRSRRRAESRRGEGGALTSRTSSLVTKESGEGFSIKSTLPSRRVLMFLTLASDRWHEIVPNSHGKVLTVVYERFFMICHARAFQKNASVTR